MENHVCGDEDKILEDKAQINLPPHNFRAVQSIFIDFINA